MEKPFKVVLLGEGSVGKTSTVMRYCNNTFTDKHETTVQGHFKMKNLNLDGQRVSLAIWDTAGQERFHALGPIYYRDAHGALLVYDITDADSFARVQNWVRELRKMLGNDVTLVLAGNKCDLERMRVVALTDAERYAESVGARHYSTSAKLNKGISELFIDLSQRMLARRSQQLASSTTARVTPGKRAISFDDAAPPPSARDKGCCGS